SLLEAHFIDLLGALESVCAREGLESHLCMAGGIALNIVANELAYSRSDFEQVYIPPHCGDDGTAIGAALLHWHHTLGNPTSRRSDADVMYSLRDYIGEIEPALRACGDAIVVEWHANGNEIDA